MPVRGWILAFAITTLIEVPIVVWLTRDLELTAPKRTLIAVFGQLATHPIVWFVLPFIPRLTGWQTFLVSEAWAWGAEALLYATVMPGLSGRRAAGISGVANGLSVAVGLCLL